jgi:hypothetical protein
MSAQSRNTCYTAIEDFGHFICKVEDGTDFVGIEVI